MTNFKILYNYFRDIGECSSRLDMAAILDVAPRTIDNWCDKGYPITKAKLKPATICRILFITDKNKLDFLSYLEQQGLLVPTEYKDPNKFELFFYMFLKETNIDKKNFKFNSDIFNKLTNENVDDNEYFSQKLFKKNTEEEKFNISNPDFSYFNINNRILVEGPGGQGKSLFFNKLYEKATCSNAYSAVIIIKLIDLVSLTEEDLIPISSQYYQKCEKCLNIISYLNKVNDVPEDIYKYVLNDIVPDKPFLLLLDGLNELFTSPNISKIATISNEIRYITNKWKSAQILISTRLSEDTYRYNNLDYISNYDIHTLSGVPESDYSEFIENNKGLSDEIKEFAKIPLYFNTLIELENTDKLNLKYDVLNEIYLQRYRQTKQDANSFFAFYILAPLLAQKINKKTGNRIHKTDIIEVAQKISSSNWSLLSETAQLLCGDRSIITINDINIDDACRVLMQEGPFVTLANGYYRFFHDEIRDYMLTYSTLLFMFTLKAAAKDDNIDFDYIDNIKADYNLADNPAKMLKQQLGLVKGADIEQALNTHYDFLKDINKKITPARIIYAHTAFLISDYLTLGSEAVEPTHNILLNFQRRVNSNVKNNTLEKIFVGLTDDQIFRCKKALTEILSKHCEYYRIKKEYENGLKAVEIAEAILPNQENIINQKAKLYIMMHREYVLNNNIYVANFEFFDYSELFKEGINLLKKAIEKDFNLSVNSLSMITSFPAPYLLEDKNITINIDFVEAFRLNYNLIFTDKHNNYIIREIDYTVRQAVSLLLKGYVKCNPNNDCFCGDELTEDTIIPGDKNPLVIDSTTLAFAKQLISLADGTNRPSMSYLRGMVLFFEGKYEQAKEFFEKENGTVLKDIILHYYYDVEYDFEQIFKNIKDVLYNEELNYADRCHPIYWYCDAKNLELAFNPSRKSFFNEFEKELPDKWKKLVKQLTL
ncbi:MAG: hypothetical protein IJN03_00010 [Bacilli bacterium]|nr:hypothetical protein [Bacilli bacterium]